MKTIREDWIRGYEALLKDLDTPSKAATVSVVKAVRLLVRERLDVLRQEQQETQMETCPWCGIKDQRRKDYVGEDATPRETCQRCGHSWRGWEEWREEHQLARLKGAQG